MAPSTCSIAARQEQGVFAADARREIRQGSSSAPAAIPVAQQMLIIAAPPQLTQPFEFRLAGNDIFTIRGSDPATDAPAEQAAHGRYQFGIERPAKAAEVVGIQEVARIRWLPERKGGVNGRAKGHRCARQLGVDGQLAIRE